MMGHYKQQNFKLQWNPVNTFTNGPKKLAVLTSARINEGFFLQENVWPFCLAAQKSGRNNEIAGGSTVLRSISRKNEEIRKVALHVGEIVFVGATCFSHKKYSLFTFHI